MDASTLAQKVIPAILDSARDRDSLRAALEPAFEEYRFDNPEALLAQRAGCDKASVFAFALCVGAELSLAASDALLSSDKFRSGRLTVGHLQEIAEVVFEGVSLVGPASPLRRSHLIEVAEGNPFAARPVVVASSVMWGLVGDTHQDPDLPASAELMSSGVSEATFYSLLVSGPDATRRRDLALARLPLDMSLVVKEPVTKEHWSASIREATIANVNLVVELEQGLTQDGIQILNDAIHLPIAILSEAPLDIDNVPDRSWAELATPNQMASSEEIYAATKQEIENPLTADQLRRLEATIPLVDGDVSRAVRRLADQRLFKFGTRISPERSWEDLIIPDLQLTELRDLANRFRYSENVRRNSKAGRFVPAGILALLAGVSGTGKTLAAEVLAQDLNLELVKIDLSALVSKYIGETEKNLDQVFEAAAVGGALLLFDEGDAIFGQRSAVNDARDRYANMEVSYLLQRVETFSGFVLITTNLAGNVDDAFRRRLQIMIELPEPDQTARRAIWSLHLGENECAPEVDVDELAKLELTGGQIRNVAVSAAILAAATASLIDLDDIQLALKRELRQQGRLADSLRL
mgnify:FL=1